MVRAEDFIPLTAATSRGSIQQGLSVAGGALDFFHLGLATDKRYSLKLMGILNRYPEQTNDRRGLAAVGVICLAVALGFNFIEVPMVPSVFLVGGVLSLVASLALSRRAFAWLQSRWYLFL
jgi:hypothetical protein